MKKKKILIHSNFCKAFTGFGKHKKNLLKYLFNTGKYEIIELANGYGWNDLRVKSTPWKTYGSLPDDQEKLKKISSDDSRKNRATYGAEMIDYAIKEIKPDIYLGIEDIWAFKGFFDKPWWNKIHCIVHTTLDSLPILPDAREAASKIKNYFVWASFAEKALKDEGYHHVTTVRGSLETKNFYKLDSDSITKYKKGFRLDDSFVIGFVFRNQLRKSVPNLLDGFNLFLKNKPESNAKLLLHTNWSEGWDIPRLLKEKNIDSKNVLTTYICKECSNFFINNFVGQNKNCPACKKEKSLNTTNISKGVTEEQLNLIYNLMDVYCHPFTSGGQEIPLQEAKLCELITLTTNYSCGEDSCTEESGGLPLEWSEYREPGTQFIKATTCPISIKNQLEKVYNMPAPEKDAIGKKSRKFVIDNYGIEKVGKIFEDLFDSLPDVDFDFSCLESKTLHQDPYYVPDESLSDREWVESLYDNILKRKDESGVTHWIQRLSKDLTRDYVLNYFKGVAFSELRKEKFSKFVEENTSSDKKILYIEPSGSQEVIIASGILYKIKDQYPDYKIYFSTTQENSTLIDSHPLVEDVFIYEQAEHGDPLKLEGKGDKPKLFDMVFFPSLSIRNNYTRNCQDKLEYKVYESN